MSEFIPATPPAASTGEELVAKVVAARSKILGELAHAVIGQQEVLELIIIALLSRGHCLLTGVPGLGKTLLAKSIAEIFSLSFKRIQFTPDLMPADICGAEVVEEDPVTGRRSFTFVRGPVFANMVLADEINRTPPKTQAALLEAMEERQVTAAGKTLALEPPFFVLATQNPIELEGTYPLPEAQLDRFLFNVIMGYLTTADEEEMVRRTTTPAPPPLQKVFTGAEIVALQQLVREVPAPANVVSYAVRLVSATRPGPGAQPRINEMVKFGAGSRASQALVLAGKARALLQGRYNVACEDVRALAEAVLRHRMVTNFHASAEGVSTGDLVRQLLASVPETK